jgi:hypothetical protein
LFVGDIDIYLYISLFLNENDFYPRPDDGDTDCDYYIFNIGLN